MCYGGELGPDLVHVAQYHKMAVEEVICRHTAEDYLVYMLGFIAGFPYLGGMDEQLATPRLTTPRIRIESGSDRSVSCGGSRRVAADRTNPSQTI